MIGKIPAIKIFFFCLLLSARCWAAEGDATSPPSKPKKPKPLVAEHVLRIKDARKLKSMIQENDWWKEFLRSNLYRGMFARQALVFDALGEQNANAWSGRLIDFIYDRFLDKRPLSISYFHFRRLVSPFGFTLYDMGSTERKLIETFLGHLGSGKPVSTEIIDPAGQTRQISVSPIHIRGHKFALVIHGDCISLSADPKVAAALSLKCEKVGDIKSDGEIETSLKSFAAPAFGMLTKYFKSAPTIRTELSWNSSSHSFEPTQMLLGMGGDSAFSPLKTPPELLKAVPGDSQFVATLFVPKPPSFSREDMNSTLLQPPGTLKSRDHIPLTLLFMGMKKDPAKDPKDRKPTVSLTAALLPAQDTSENSLKQIDLLFSKKVFYDVRYKLVCNRWIALADSDEAIEEIEKTCRGEIPSFEQVPPSFKKRLAEEPSVGWAYLHIGRALNSMLELGAVGEEKPPSAAVLKSSQELLGKLPRVLFAGTTEGNQVVLKGVAQ